MSPSTRSVEGLQIELEETYRSVTLLTTEISQINEQLRLSNQNLADLYSTALQFVDNVSHEFRTPLSVIKEFSSILHDGIAGALNQEQREYAGIILARVDDLTLMVGDLLDISRLESGLVGVHRRPHRCSEILEGVRTTLERRTSARGVELEIDLAPDLPAVYCDAEKAGRVIVNLGINASKFCSDGSKVAVWARNEAERSEVVIGISDSGPGIAPENVEAIFERFNQLGNESDTDTRGFGLGLNIAKELVQLNLGDIGVESERGIGSTFTFTIPAYDPIRIVKRFAERLDAVRAGSEHVSILTVTADTGIEGEASDELQRLLEEQMRRSDLVFKPRMNHWLVCVATSRAQVLEVVERIREAAGESLHFELHGGPPELEVSVNGTWNVLERPHAFASAFAALWHESVSGHLPSAYSPPTAPENSRAEHA